MGPLNNPLLCAIIHQTQECVVPSYGTDQGLEDYLMLTGRELPDGANPTVLRHWGTQYVDSFEDMYCGVALSPDNSFPRDLWPVVPERVEHAAYEAALAYAEGVPLFGGGGTSGGQVIKERVDGLEVQYAAPTGDWWGASRFIWPLAYSLLLPFLCLPQEDDGKGCVGRGAAFVV